VLHLPLNLPLKVSEERTQNKRKSAQEIERERTINEPTNNGVETMNELERKSLQKKRQTPLCPLLVPVPKWASIGRQPNVGGKQGRTVQTVHEEEGTDEGEGESERTRKGKDGRPSSRRARCFPLRNSKYRQQFKSTVSRRHLSSW
jgi:hypothetical protein